MEINQIKEIQVNAKTLSICCKVTDRLAATLYDQDGQEIYSQDEGYVPGFMPGDHFGDYIMLDIDIDTGQIVNWNKTTADAIEAWIGEEHG